MRAREGGPATLTEHTVAAAARDAGLDPGEGRVRYVQVTGSTNSDLMDLAAAGAPAWTVLVAGHQERGRGRLGRSWDAPPGSGLLVSVLLRTDGEPYAAPLASFAAAVAMVDALRESCGLTASSKWPNDVLVGERKVAGILSEGRVESGRLSYVVTGVGVNVLQREGELPGEGPTRATSVAIEGGTPDPAGLLAAYLRGFHVLAPPGAVLGETILTRYREVCSTLGRRVRAMTAGGVAIEGLAVELGPAGELVVQTHRGREAVTFGEVAHQRPAGEAGPA